jgi:D-arabinose 1-dehydrogenase-like Zn-dependent alcohol dehydrogenase
MAGILGADGGFAEYMVTTDYAAVHLPDSLSPEQAAPLMCARVSNLSDQRMASGRF